MNRKIMAPALAVTLPLCWVNDLAAWESVLNINRGEQGATWIADVTSPPP